MKSAGKQKTDLRKFESGKKSCVILFSFDPNQISETESAQKILRTTLTKFDGKKGEQKLGGFF
jgi:hypothetical protein